MGERRPGPAGIERVAPEPAAARWDTALGEFVLDYDDVRAARDPGAALHAFLDSTYPAGAVKARMGPGPGSAPAGPNAYPKENPYER